MPKSCRTRLQKSVYHLLQIRLQSQPVAIWLLPFYQLGCKRAKTVKPGGICVDAFVFNASDMMQTNASRFSIGGPTRSISRCQPIKQLVQTPEPSTALICVRPRQRYLLLRRRKAVFSTGPHSRRTHLQTTQRAPLARCSGGLRSFRPGFLHLVLMRCRFKGPRRFGEPRNGSPVGVTKCSSISPYPSDVQEWAADKQLEWSERQLLDFVVARKSSNPHLCAAVESPCPNVNCGYGTR